MGCGVIAANTMAVAHFGHGAVVAVMSGMAIAATGASFIAALPALNAASSSLTSGASAPRQRAVRAGEPPHYPMPQPGRSAAPVRGLAVVGFFVGRVGLRAGIRDAARGLIGQLKPFGRHFAVNDA